MAKEIGLTKGKNALVDDDFESAVSWHASIQGKSFYAKARINKKLVYMHRMIAGAKKGDEVDHINGDTLDNRRENLRIVNRTLNNYNRKETKGFYKVKGKYRAEVWMHNKKYYAGTHDTPEQARRAYINKRNALLSEYYPGFSV